MLTVGSTCVSLILQRDTLREIQRHSDVGIGLHEVIRIFSQFLETQPGALASRRGTVEHRLLERVSLLGAAVS